MTKFETIWKQLSALVLGGIKFYLSSNTLYWPSGSKVEAHTGEAGLNLAEEAGSFICEILKDLGNKIAEESNNMLEASITESEPVENTKISLEELETTDVEGSGGNTEDLAATLEKSSFYCLSTDDLHQNRLFLKLHMMY